MIYLSPFLFSWKLILLGFVVLTIQDRMFKQCILTRAQFGKDQYTTFHAVYLEKLGFKFKRKNVYNTTTYIIPFVLLAIALIWQIVLGKGILF
jgi:hypothetical protein